MKHFTLCIKCENENPNSMNWAVGEINSDLLALCVCKHGHKTVSGLMHYHFDVLYMSAVDSYINGFYSESVMSFAVALERVYEMFIKVTLLRDGVSLEKADEFWKEINNQSERQYGAFCAQYIKVTGIAWKFNSNKSGFRNKVVHSGFIATSIEVKEYAEYITNCIVKIIKILQDEFHEESQKYYFYQMSKSKITAENLMKENNAQYIATSTISLLKCNQNEIIGVTFDMALKKMMEHNIEFRC